MQQCWHCRRLQAEEFILRPASRPVDGHRPGDRIIKTECLTAMSSSPQQFVPGFGNDVVYAFACVFVTILLTIIYQFFTRRGAPAPPAAAPSAASSSSDSATLPSSRVANSQRRSVSSSAGSADASVSSQSADDSSSASVSRRTNGATASASPAHAPATQSSAASAAAAAVAAAELQMPDLLQCPICLSLLEHACETSCSHAFCASCILDYWLRTGMSFFPLLFDSPAILNCTRDLVPSLGRVHSVISWFISVLGHCAGTQKPAVCPMDRQNIHFIIPSRTIRAQCALMPAFDALAGSSDSKNSSAAAASAAEAAAASAPSSSDANDAVSSSSSSAAARDRARLALDQRLQEYNRRWQHQQNALMPHSWATLATNMLNAIQDRLARL